MGRFLFRTGANIEAAPFLAPVFGFLGLLFFLPIVLFMWAAVDNSDLAKAIPQARAVLAEWDGSGLPPDAAAAALAADGYELAKEPLAMGRFVRRMNFHVAGARTTLLRTFRALDETALPQTVSELTALDPAWGERDLWLALAQQSSSSITPTFLLAAIDLSVDESGNLQRVPAERAIYLDVLLRTIWLSIVTTILAALLAYPAAYTLASAHDKREAILLSILFISIWVSLLIKTLAWTVIFQKEGTMNQLMIAGGLIDGPIQLLRTRFAVLVGMVHMLLPFMILPIYSVMKRVPRNLFPASLSLGAGPVRSFLRVYLPMTAPGLAAGCTLVSVLALGFYVTPQILGGPQDQTTSYYVAFHTNKDVNWPLASALGCWLIAVAVAISIAINWLARRVNPVRQA